MSIDPAALPDDIDALKRIIGELTREAVAARAQIEKLRFQLDRLRRAQFGRSSEKIDRTIEQLELAIETLDEDHAQRTAAVACQTALERDPLSASKRDPFDRRARAVALAPSELAGVAETARARLV